MKLCLARSIGKSYAARHAAKRLVRQAAKKNRGRVWKTTNVAKKRKGVARVSAFVAESLSEARFHYMRHLLS